MNYVSIPESEYHKLKADAAKVNQMLGRYFVSFRFRLDPDGDYLDVQDSYVAPNDLDNKLEYYLQRAQGYLQMTEQHRIKELEEELENMKKKWWYKLFN